MILTSKYRDSFIKNSPLLNCISENILTDTWLNKLFKGTSNFFYRLEKYEIPIVFESHIILHRYIIKVRVPPVNLSNFHVYLKRM